MRIILALVVVIRVLYSIGEMVFEKDWPRATWKGLVAAIFFFALAVSAFGQITAVRYDWTAQTINQGSPQPGGLYPALNIPGIPVQICNYPASGNPCTNYATTYTNAAESSTCTAPTQLTRQGSTTCVANTDPEGGFGAWLAPGCYQYTAQPSYGSYGPYDFCVGGTSGASPALPLGSQQIYGLGGVLGSSEPYSVNPFTGVQVALTAGVPSLTIPSGYSGSTTYTQNNSANATAGCSQNTTLGTITLYPLSLGFGYVTPPTVTITGGSGTATFTANLSGGRVTSYTSVTNSGWTSPVTTGSLCPATITVGASPAAPAPVPILNLKEGMFSYTPHIRCDDFGAVGDGVTDDSQVVQNCLNYAASIYQASGTAKQPIVDFTANKIYFFGSFNGYYLGGGDDGTGPTVSDTCAGITCLNPLPSETPTQIGYSVLVPGGVVIHGNGATFRSGFSGSAVAVTGGLTSYSNAWPYGAMFASGNGPQHVTFQDMNISNAFIGWGNIGSYVNAHNINFYGGCMVQGANSQFNNWDTINVSANQPTQMSLFCMGGVWAYRAPNTGAQSSSYLNGINLVDSFTQANAYAYAYPNSSPGDFTVKRRAFDCWMDTNFFHLFDQGIVNSDDCPGLMGYQLGNTTVAVTTNSGSGSGGTVLTLTGANQLLTNEIVTVNAPATSNLAPLNGLWMPVSNPTGTTFQITIPSASTATVAACTSSCTATVTVVRMTDQDLAAQVEPDSLDHGWYGNVDNLYTRYGRPINGTNINGITDKGYAGYPIVEGPNTIGRQTNYVSTEGAAICSGSTLYGTNTGTAATSCPNPYEPQNIPIPSLGLFDSPGQDTNYFPDPISSTARQAAIAYPWNYNSNYNRFNSPNDPLTSPFYLTNATSSTVLTSPVQPMGVSTSIVGSEQKVFQAPFVQLNSDAQPLGPFCGSGYNGALRPSCWSMVGRESLQAVGSPSIFEFSHQFFGNQVPSNPGSAYVNLFGYVSDPLGTRGGNVSQVVVDTPGSGYPPWSAVGCTIANSPVHTPGSSTAFYAAQCQGFAGANGTVTQAQVYLPGVGYTSAPAVTFAAPPTGTTATGHTVFKAANQYYPIGHHIIAATYLNAGGSIAANSTTTLSPVSCPGAIFSGSNTGNTDSAVLLNDSSLYSPANLIVASAYVTAANTCSITFYNGTSSAGTYSAGSGNNAWQFDLKTSYQTFSTAVPSVVTSTPTVTTASWGGSSSGGTITGVTAGTGLSGGGTSGTVTLNIANTAVTAGSYTTANITVNAQGQVTAASNGSASGNTTSTSLTTNTLPVANGANSIINSLFTDTSGAGVYSGASGFQALSFTAPGLSTGPTISQFPGYFKATENVNSSVTCGAGSDLLVAGGTIHHWQKCENGSGFTSLVGIGSVAPAGDVAVFAANGIDIVDGGAPTGTGTVTHTTGPLTALQLMIGNAANDSKVDPNASTDGAGNLSVVSLATNASTQGFNALGVGTGTITATLPTSYVGLIGPPSGTPAYFLQLPSAAPSGGQLMQFATPSTVNGVNQAVGSWITPSGTGTVTSVTVTGANGIGTSGCTITTSGTCALSLGAITPTSGLFTGQLGAEESSFVAQTGLSVGTFTGSGTNAYGIYVNAPTGASNNLAMQLNNSGGTAEFRVDNQGNTNTSTSVGVGNFVTPAVGLNNAVAAIQIASPNAVTWSSTTASNGTKDTTLCRSSAGVLEVGSSTGCANSGSLALAVVIAGGTQSISGCSLTGGVGGASAGSFASGATGTCTVTITPGITASHGFVCGAKDITTTADTLVQTAYTTTTCTVAGTTVSGDTIVYNVDKAF